MDTGADAVVVEARRAVGEGWVVEREAPPIVRRRRRRRRRW